MWHACASLSVNRAILATLNCMQFRDEQIRAFIDAWQADFGETLSVEAARSEALRLLDFFAWMVEELGFQERQATASVPTDSSPP